MILANVRQHLTRDDAQLALRLIARGSSDVIEEGEVTLREQGIDALLDDPRLYTGLIVAGQGAHASFPLFAYVVVRHALRDVGEGDRMLADYVASILLHFGLGTRAGRVAESDDEIYTTLAELAGALESADAQRSFLVRAHLGNYALWLRACSRNTSRRAGGGKEARTSTTTRRWGGAASHSPPTIASPPSTD